MVLLLIHFKFIGQHNYERNESTSGADVSVEMPKLHNIKLLIAFIDMMNLLHATQRVGNDRP